jgi:hypothetical protein
MTWRRRTGFAWAVSARDDVGDSAYFGGAFGSGGGVELMAPFGGGVEPSAGGVVVVPGDVD